MDEQQRKYYMTRRQTLIMELGALEDLLGLERSVVPKRKRETVTYGNERDKLILEQYRTPRG